MALTVTEKTTIKNVYFKLLAQYKLSAYVDEVFLAGDSALAYYGYDVKFDVPHFAMTAEAWHALLANNVGLTLNKGATALYITIKNTRGRERVLVSKANYEEKVIVESGLVILRTDVIMQNLLKDPVKNANRIAAITNFHGVPA